MALNIKDPETEKLAAEVAAITGESKTRAVKVALQERKQRLAARVVRRDRVEELRRFLAQEVWPRSHERPWARESRDGSARRFSGTGRRVCDRR